MKIVTYTHINVVHETGYHCTEIKKTLHKCCCSFVIIIDIL